MGKAPADQFYWNDWISDVELQSCCSATRGIWMNALCRMWFAKPRGELTMPTERYPYFLNCTLDEFKQFEQDAQALGFCEVSHNTNGNLTVRNRRMYRRGKDQESGRLRQQRYYDKHKDDSPPNGDITPPSSSSPSSSLNTKEEYIQLSVRLRDKTYFWITAEKILEYQKSYPNLNVRQELLRLIQWNQDNPSKRKTKQGILRHINTWLSSAQERRERVSQELSENHGVQNQKRDWADVRKEMMEDDGPPSQNKPRKQKDVKGEGKRTKILKKWRKDREGKYAKTKDQG